MATVRKRTWRNGSGKIQSRWVVDYYDQNGKRQVETPKGPFRNKELEKRAAHELLARRQREIDAGTFVARSDRLTVAELAERWLESKVRARATTISDYRIMLDCYLLPCFGPRQVESLRRADVERFRAELSSGVPEAILRVREAKERALKEKDPRARLKPLTPGPRTVNKCLGVLVSLLRYAQQHNYVTGNVAERIEKLPTTEGENRVIEQNVLTPEELRRVLDAARDPFRIPIALAIYTGMRQGECLGLQWGDVDWNRKTVEVRRTFRCGEFYQPKTKSSRRTVELPPELLTELKQWRLACKKGDHDLVCPSATGLPMQGSALLQQGFLPALRRAGVRRVRFHDLRHSYASNLLAAGVDIVTVQTALGHANAHITLTTYSHAVPKPRQGASDRMAALMHGTGSKLVSREAPGAEPAERVSA